MGKIVIEYRYIPSEKKGVRRNSSEMRYYLEGLIDEMRSAGIDSEYIDSVALDDDANEVTINRVNVLKILDGLEIKKLDDEDCGCGDSPKMIKLERPDSDWKRDVVEDIPDVIMKNAVSKVYADMNRDRTAGL